MTSDSLDRGREHFQQSSWAAAFGELSRADRDSALNEADLERLAISAFLVGRHDECVAAWERAFQSCRDDRDVPRAARSAFWLAFVLLNHGELARGGGWVHRARRLLDRSQHECVERGYVEYAEALRRVLAGDARGAAAGFATATEIGEGYGDHELVALAQVGRGRCLIRTGETVRGMALLDEAMSMVPLGDISVAALGDLYCTVIDGCQEVLDVGRAQEWTEALSRWCAAQPDLVLYHSQCLVHRAELMLLGGLWPQALREVERACDRLARPRSQPALGAAFYVRAELHRLRGEEADAEAAYRQADHSGREPQPGLAQLWLAQGRTTDAESALRRCLDAAGDDPVPRVRLLGPYVEVALAAGGHAAARAAAEELSRINAEWNSPYLHAVEADAWGSVLLAEADAGRALPLLRRARSSWVELAAPYEAARTRLLVARACQELGDQASAALELDAARLELDRLGASADIIGRAGGTARRNGLTTRELDVLRQLATGKTNRAIASALFISEKTAASHVSSILRKLDVESRAAATAYAHQHHLL